MANSDFFAPAIVVFITAAPAAILAAAVNPENYSGFCVHFWSFGGELASEKINILLAVVGDEGVVGCTFKSYVISQTWDLLTVSPGLIRRADKIFRTSDH